MINHFKVVNDALHDLIVQYFTVPVSNKKVPVMDWRRGEFINFWCTEQNFISNNSDGETREYGYDIGYYFNEKKLGKTKLEDLIGLRVETLKSKLTEFVTYQVPTYRWHDAKIADIEIEELEEQPGIWVAMLRFECTRFNQR